MSKSSSHSEPEQDKKHESKETGSFSKERQFQPEEKKSLAKFDLSKSEMLALNPSLPQLPRSAKISDGTTTQSFNQSFEEDQFVVKIPTYVEDGNFWKYLEHEACMTFYAQQASGRVLKMKKVFYFENYFGLGFERMPVSLEKWIKNPKIPLSWHNRFSIALEIAKALVDLHAHGIIHGRIRSCYVFCDTEKGEVKLTGFRYARLKNVPPPMLCVKATMTLKEDCYLSPETLKDNSMETGSDIYCFGNFLYELATGHRPFAEAEIENYISLCEKMKTGETSAIDQNCPLKELIQSCWSFDPAKRPTAAELVKTLTALTFWPKIYVWLWPAPNSMWQRGLPEDILFHIASFLRPYDNDIDIGFLVKHTIFIKIKQLLMKRLNSFAEAKPETVPLGAPKENTIFITIKQLLMKQLNFFAEAKPETVPLGTPKEKKLPTRLIGLFHNINNCEALSASVQTQINLLPEGHGDEEQQAVRATLQRNHSRLSLLS
jgi:serine/threonine protein kinase